MTPLRYFALSLTATALAGCAVGPNYHTPDEHPPAQFAAVHGERSMSAKPSSQAPQATQVDFAAWWRSLNDARQDVFVQLAFNMGIHGLLEFKRMLGFAKSGAFDKASVELLNSTWASQVKTRAWRLASQLRTGLRP